MMGTQELALQARPMQQSAFVMHAPPTSTH
jgi:hypothetical protein